MKTVRQHELCAGLNCSPQQNARYWNAWEAGEFRKGKPPENPTPIIARLGGSPRGRSVRMNGGGPGTELSRLLEQRFGFTKLPGCDCASHAARMDAWGIDGCERELDTIAGWIVAEAKARSIPFAGTWAAKVIARQLVQLAINNARRTAGLLVERPREIEPVAFDSNIRRNFLMHIWPHKETGAWRWNCDQVLRRAKLFNGRRVVAIARDQSTDPPEAVKKYLSEFTDEFIVVRNQKRLREVTSFEKLLSSVESLDKNEVTFCCHSKGTRAQHGGIRNRQASTVFRWTEVMYESCLDYWPLVREDLESYAMTGSFKRYGQFTTPGNHRWHYSGTFYWFRNRDVFRRNWRHIDQMFFGSESWPGHMFLPDETGCLFFDGVDDLYKPEYWDSEVTPRFEQWKMDHEERAVRQQ